MASELSSQEQEEPEGGVDPEPDEFELLVAGQRSDIGI
jgi:hypothetical protein